MLPRLAEAVGWQAATASLACFDIFGYSCRALWEDGQLLSRAQPSWPPTPNQVARNRLRLPAKLLQSGGLHDLGVPVGKPYRIGATVPRLGRKQFHSAS